MDVGIDQARPWAINDKGEKYRDLVRYESGKYLYRMQNGELEIDRFNHDFEQYRQRRIANMKKNIQKINKTFQLKQLRESKQNLINNIEINDPVSKNKYLWIIFAMIFCIFSILCLF